MKILPRAILGRRWGIISADHGVGTSASPAIRSVGFNVSVMYMRNRDCPGLQSTIPLEAILQDTSAQPFGEDRIGLRGCKDSSCRTTARRFLCNALQLRCICGIDTFHILDTYISHSSCSTVAVAAAAACVVSPSPATAVSSLSRGGASPCARCPSPDLGIGAVDTGGGLKNGSPSSSASSCIRKVSQSSISCGKSVNLVL